MRDRRRVVRHRRALPPVDVDNCAPAMIAVGLGSARGWPSASPPGVEGATRFASTLFLGALERSVR